MDSGAVGEPGLVYLDGEHAEQQKSQCEGGQQSARAQTHPWCFFFFSSPAKVFGILESTRGSTRREEETRKREMKRVANQTKSNSAQIQHWEGDEIMRETEREKRKKRKKGAHTVCLCE